MSTERVGAEFFHKPCVELAKNLLGSILVRKLNDNTILKGTIVETECYLGNEDKASHSYNGRRTERNEPMYMEPGTCYVYYTFGMYHCFNISSCGDGVAVLLRAIEPLENQDQMAQLRNDFDRKRNKNAGKSVKRKDYKTHELCNGPGKLCISFDIDVKTCNKENLATSTVLWIERRRQALHDLNFVASSRIGIDSAGSEWANKLLRFYIYANRSVSKRDAKREKMLLSIASA